MLQKIKSWPRSLTVPAFLFFLTAILAIGPLYWFDKDMHHWYARQDSANIFYLYNSILDRISGQIVVLPLLIFSAIILTLSYKNWRPLILAAGAELAFAIAGFWKFIFARNAPRLSDSPAFFDGGFFVHGHLGMSFPSGHSTESILIFGLVIYLWTFFLNLSKHWELVLTVLWCCIIVTTSWVSFWLGYHWITDLIGGLFNGLFFLNLLKYLDSKYLLDRLPITGYWYNPIPKIFRKKIKSSSNL